MKKIRLAYFGSPDFAADFLEKLITDTSMYRYIEVQLVVTQADQPVGRKQILTPTSVKITALKHSLEVLEIKNLKFIKNLDLALVYAYGDLIPKELLVLPKYGFWNIHPSLLPKYRGPSPIASSLINGDKTTGVTIIKMDEEIDHGPIIVQQSFIIKKIDKRPDLEKRLTDLAFEMFKKLILTNFNQLKPTVQADELATYTKKLTKQDGFIPFGNWKLEIGNSPEKIFNLFRGLYPWPGLWTILPNGKRLKITDIKLINGKLILKKVQLEGKKEVGFEMFNKAYKIF